MTQANSNPPPSGQTQPQLSDIQKAALLLSRAGINLDAMMSAMNSREALHKSEKQSSGRLMSLFGISVIANVIMFGVFVSGYFPKTKFLPVANAKAVCELKPVSEPLIDQGAVAQFASDAVTTGYRFDFQNYRDQITLFSEQYLTPEFRNKFMTAIGDSSLLKTTIEGYYSVQATIPGRPQITRAGLNPATGKYEWTVSVPADVTFKSGAKSHREEMVIDLRIVRTIPTDANPRGVAVDNIIAQQRSK